MAKKDATCKCKTPQNCGSGAVYGIGLVGAIVYYIVTATSFWMGVLGVLKALVWPAFVVYALMKSLGM